MSRGIYDKVNKVLIPTAGLEDASVPTFTMAEWEAMTDAQKAEYDGKLFVISDDFNGMSVDDELSDTSIRPVQNKVITEEINSISDEISDMNNVLGSKNLLQNNATSQVINGITWTVNSDGTVRAQGAVTSGLDYSILWYDYHDLDVGEYILSGCPSGGGSDKWGIWFASASSDIGVDFGNGEKFTLSSKTSVRVRIGIVTHDNIDLTFYPMIRPASIKDDTYVPYAMTNKELTDSYKHIAFEYVDITGTTDVNGRIAVADGSAGVPIAVVPISWTVEVLSILINNGGIYYAQTNYNSTSVTLRVYRMSR